MSRMSPSTDKCHWLSTVSAQPDWLLEMKVCLVSSKLLRRRFIISSRRSHICHIYMLFYDNKLHMAATNFKCTVYTFIFLQNMMPICHKRITLKSIWTVAKQGAHIAQPFTLWKINSRYFYLDIKTIYYWGTVHCKEILYGW